MKMKRNLVITIILFAVLTSRACETRGQLTRDELMASPLMSAEHLAQYSPAYLLTKISHLNNAPGISLACEDRIYQAYAKRIAPVVDRHYGKASTLRPHLVAALRKFNHFIAGTHHGGGTGIGHWDNRIPGHLEWAMLSGSRCNFRVEGAGYTQTDIRNTVTVLFKAQFYAQGPEDLPGGKSHKRIMRLLDEALAHWQKAEGLMTEEEGKYFRNIFMKVIAKRL
jgi:hypothetical protein